MGNIETDILVASKPRKNPELALKQRGNTFLLFGKNGEHPLFEINQAGKMVWEGCDGKNTPHDISRVVHGMYTVSPHQAYVDCLYFLAHLKLKGAIKL